MGTKMIEEMARRVCAEKPCRLCGAEDTPYFGMFFPRNSQKWGVGPGKGLMILYPLCADCYNNGEPDAESAEQLLWLEATPHRSH